MVGLILAGGPLRPSERLLARAREAAIVVAADGGLRHATALGVRPDLLVGDLDSVSEADRARWPDLAVERHPTDKDALDLELAIEAARVRGADELRIMGAFGGRFDQTLATASIAARYAEAGVRIALLDGIHDAYPLTAGDRFDGTLPAGTVFSLLATTDEAQVDVSGATYDLHGARLPRGVGLGLSNRVETGPHVEVHAGTILLIVEWDA